MVCVVAMACWVCCSLVTAGLGLPPGQALLTVLAARDFAAVE